MILSLGKIGESKISDYNGNLKSQIVIFASNTVRPLLSRHLRNISKCLLNRNVKKLFIRDAFLYRRKKDKKGLCLYKKDSDDITQYHRPPK